MIRKLTKEQEARFPEFIEKWTKVGLSTEPANRPEAEAGLIEAYKISGLAAPKIVWCGSPLSQGLTRAIVFGLKPTEWKQLIGDSVWDSVGASVWDSVWDSMRDSVRASVWDSVWDSVRDSGYGQHDASWLGFYDYFRVVCELEKETERLFGLWKISKNAGWWLPHKNLCWISERHCTLNCNAQGRLHKDGGPALAYPDGWGIYALNGVRMKSDYVLTPAEKLSPKIVLDETNAEIRRELLRKIGMERFLQVCPHKTLETKGNYQLLSIPLSEQIKDSRWLKMVNPSIGVFHVEAVAPECATVQQAINWRSKQTENWEPEILT